MESEPLLDQTAPERKRSSIWEGKDGALGWTVATAIMLINFITIGLGRMSGILYVDFMREFKVNRKLASAPFSVQQSARNLFGPLVGVLGQRFGIRSVTIVGGLLGAGSAAACAFAKDITWITIFWGGVYGTGIAFTSTLSQVILDDYFEKNLSSASGLSFSGGSVGAMVFSFVLQRTIDDYGLENAYFIMGAIILLVVPLALTLTSPPWPKVTKTTKKGENLINNANLASDPHLTKPLRTEVIFSNEKGINKNWDKTQSLGGESCFSATESLRGINQNIVGTRSHFDKKDNTNLEFIYGTFKKNDTTFRIERNAGLSLPPQAISSYKQKSSKNSVDLEKENIAKLMASIGECYSNSKARVNKSPSQDLKGDETYNRNFDDIKTNVEKELTSTVYPDRDIVDYSVVNDLSDSNKIFSKKDPNCHKGDSEEEKSRSTGINNKDSFQVNGLNYPVGQNKPEKEIDSEYNSIDRKDCEPSRKLSSVSEHSYKLLYLRTNFQEDFPDLSFPSKTNDTILNFCETDSVNTFDDKLNYVRKSTVNDDLENLTNGETCKSYNSDNKIGKIVLNGIIVDKLVKSDNLTTKNEQSGISKNFGLSSNDQPTTSNNSYLIVDQGKSSVQDNTIQLHKSSSEVERQLNANSEDITTKKNYQLLEKQTKDACDGLIANNISKTDSLLDSDQNPDVKFLRKNTNFVIPFLMVNTSYKNLFFEELMRRQLELLYCLVEREKGRDSSEKHFIRNKIENCEIDQVLKAQEKKELDIDNKIDNLFQTEQINLFLDHLYCVFQKNERHLLSHFEEKCRVRLVKIVAELRKLYTFTCTYKTKYKKSEDFLERRYSSSSDQRVSPTEKNTKQKNKTRKLKGSRLKRKKSTSSAHETPPPSKSTWKEQSLPSKLPSSEQFIVPHDEQWLAPYDDEPNDGCCLFPRQIRMVLKLYLNPAFLVICLCRAVHLLTFMGLLTVIVDFSMDRGLKESDGKYAVTAMSLGDLIGRLCTGWVTDYTFIGLERFMLVAMFLIGLISISFPLIPPSTILLFACVYSILQGAVFIRHPILVSKYTRLEERTVGMGFMTLFSGLLGFIMPIYIGHFRDGIGAYDQVFYINGAICAGIGFLWIFEPWLRKFVR